MRVKLDITFLLVCLICVWECEAFKCGNRGQCLCSSVTRTVVCRNVNQVPRFPEKYQQGRILELVNIDNDFDIRTLFDANGYHAVRLLNADKAVCAAVHRDFSHIFCAVRDDAMMTTGIPAHEMAHVSTAFTTLEEEDVMKYQPSSRKMTTNSADQVTEAESETEFQENSITTTSITTTENSTDVLENPVTASKNSGLILWVSVSSALAILLFVCILVSLLQLHHRLNKNTGADDPPQYAVKCCLCCLNCIIFPLHLCARMCSCNCCDLLSLDREYRRQRPSRYNACTYSNQGFVQLYDMVS